MLDWKHISAKNVVDAIHMFETSNEEYPAPKNTFLEYDGKNYPAKHIRALSYKAAFGVEAPKSEFSGGEETVRFFEKLGFRVKYLPRDGKLPRSDKQNDLQYTESIGIATAQNVDDVTVKTENLDISNTKEKSIIAVTATLQHGSKETPDNRLRTKLLRNIILESKSSDIILLPAGFFSYRILDSAKIKIMINVVTNILCELSSNAAVCLGVDCEDGKDQLAFAIDQSGVLAVARKFYPTMDEKFYINAADQFDDMEMGYSRIFTKNGKKFYLAVCYDVFGIRHKNIPNPGVNVILVLAHCFYPRGRGPSGEVDFARKGFAGASQQWKCPVLGTGVFFYRQIPEKWPTGVMWNVHGKSVKSFKYSENQLTSGQEKTIFVSDESTLLRRYQL